jgi:hypothetical protein
MGHTDKKTASVSVVVNYSTNEACFIEALLEQCRKFSDDIVLSYGTHFYDGTPENMREINRLEKKHGHYVSFAQYSVDTAAPMRDRIGAVHRPTAYWHNLARWTGFLRTSRDWIIFVDADEIPDGYLMYRWLARRGTLDDTEKSMKLACYWYFREPTCQSLTHEDSVLMIHRAHVREDSVFGDAERDLTARAAPGGCTRNVVDPRDSQRVPMWHHFSFVRSRAGLALKISRWAHANDVFKNTPVQSFVDSVYSPAAVEDIVDPVHGYRYRTVPNVYGLNVES